MTRFLRVFGLAGALLPLHLAALAVEETKLTNDWSVLLADRSDSTPALGADGTLYFGTFRGKLWAVTAEGARKWVFQAGREIKSSPALSADGTVYFGSRDRKFYAVGPDGKQRWAYETGAWVDSSPALAEDGTVYFGSWDNQFYALGIDGRLRWKFPTGGPVVSSPAVSTNGTVYFGSQDARLYALKPDGSKVWDYATRGAIVSSPALDAEQRVYFTSVDGHLYALNPDGTLRWRLHTGGYTEASPAIAGDGTIYLGVKTNFVAVSSEGKKLWSRPLHELTDSTPLLLADNSIVYISRYGLLVCETPRQERLWTFYTYGYGYASPVVDAKGRIYVYGYDEGAALLALRATQPMAAAPWPKFRGNPRNTGACTDR